jgi:integrase
MSIFTIDGEPAPDVIQAAGPSGVTLEQAMRDYIHEHVIPRGGDAKRVTAAARDLFIILGPEIRVEEMTRGHGRQYAEVRNKQGVKGATARRELTFAQAAINHAKREGRVAKVPALWKPEPSTPRLRFLSRDEYRRLMQVPMPRRIKLFFLLAFGTGARSEAIEEATWDRLNWTERTLDYRVPGVKYRNKRRVIAPLNDELFARLQSAYERRDPTDPFVIGRGRPRKNERATTYHMAKAALAAIGIDEEGVARHVARHTYATWLLQKDVPIAKVAALLGDKVSMVESTYGHLRPSDLHGAANAVAA